MDNPMKFTKCFVVLGLSILMGTCNLFITLGIDIGDYKNQLAAWNSQNMLDYQINVDLFSHGSREDALITVRNGITVDSDHSYWLEKNRPSTVLEFYSYIKELEKTSYSLKSSYNTEYHYPSSIITETFKSFREWRIYLMPLEEGDLEIDIGDYENQLDEWNSQNILDYKLEVTGYHGRYNYSTVHITETYNVKNGIPDRPSSFFGKNVMTIPDIYSFIKEEEERIRNVYNGINRSYFNVQYDTEYHYPVQISSGVDHRFGSYERWEIILTPLGE
jgi:hypothetical protein